MGFPRALVCWLLLAPNPVFWELPPPNKPPPVLLAPKAGLGVEPNKLLPVELLLVLPKPPKPPLGAAVAVPLPKRPPPLVVVVEPPNNGFCCWPKGLEFVVADPKPPVPVVEIMLALCPVGLSSMMLLCRFRPEEWGNILRDRLSLQAMVAKR